MITEHTFSAACLTV